ncbi:MAG: energy transducer TonB [Planctomycetes bacterium]|nr:energy transducer TonB [Planctomycetota bacterium]
MTKAGLLFIVAAVVLHGLVLLFGGLLFNHEPETASKRDVEIATESVTEDKERQQDLPKPEQLEKPEEPPPDPNQAPPSAVEQAMAGDDAPALDAASLSALEAALGGESGAGGGEFATGGSSLASGGRIGGRGGPGGGEEFSGAFSMSEIDQRPRPLVQVAATYPSEMRSRKAEGVVTVIFVVDETGRVTNPRVEKASHPEFEKPALEAVRQWKFEPAIRAGKRVSCRMRVPFRFTPK